MAWSRSTDRTEAALASVAAMSAWALASLLLTASAFSRAWSTCSARTETRSPLASISRANWEAWAFLSAIGSAAAGPIPVRGTNVASATMPPSQRTRGDSRLVLGFTMGGHLTNRRSDRAITGDAALAFGPWHRGDQRVRRRPGQGPPAL